MVSRFPSMRTYLETHRQISLLLVLFYWLLGTFHPSKLSCIFPQSPTTRSFLIREPTPGAAIAQWVMGQLWPRGTCRPSPDSQDCRQSTKCTVGQEKIIKERGASLPHSGTPEWGWEKLVGALQSVRNFKAQSRYLMQLHHNKTEWGIDTTNNGYHGQKGMVAEGPLEP